MTLADCVVLLQRLFLRIERSVQASECNPYVPSGSSPSIDKTTLQFVSRAALLDRSLEVDAYSSWHWAAAALVIVSEKGGEVLSIDVLNGVVSLDRLSKEHKRRGDGRSEFWSLITGHLQRLVQSRIIDATEIVQIFTSALTDFVTEASHDDGDKKRLGRKVSTLLQQAIVPADIAPLSPHPASSALRPPFLKPQGSKAHELDDDELMGDETLFKPPPLRDLAPETVSPEKKRSADMSGSKRWEESETEFSF